MAEAAETIDRAAQPAPLIKPRVQSVAAAPLSMASSEDVVPDAELVLRVARQDASSPAALEALFLRHAQPLQKFLGRILRNDAEAEDVVHDVFVRVAQTAGNYRQECQFRTWLFTMALNLSRSHMRHRVVKEKAAAAVLERETQLAARRMESDPGMNAERKELLQRVDAAMTQLGEGERETFLLYWFGQLSYAEISETTGLSVSACKVRVHRALVRLGKILKVPGSGFRVPS